MRTSLFLLITSLLAAGCDAAKPDQSIANPVFAYPETQQLPVVDEYFGTSIIDAYRWLEDDHSAATKAWVDAQDAVTFDYLDALPRRRALRDRISQLLDYERESARFEEGGYTYFSRNSGLQNQSVIYRMNEDGQEHVFLDPNTLSADGTTSVSSLST